MLKKIIILSLFLLLISSGALLAAEPDLEEIQNLISRGKTDEALQLLKNSDLDKNYDLKFYKALLLSWQEEYEQAETILLEIIESNPERLDSYNQLSRIYGWQRKFIKAESIINKAQNIEYSSERTALLSRYAEWQGNYFKAKKLIEKAIKKSESKELAAEYKNSLNRINKEIKSSFYLEGRTVYSDADREDLELTLGIEKLLRDGIDLETSAGANYFKNESNFVFRSEVEIDQPLIPSRNHFSSEFVYYKGESRDKYELNNSWDYLFDKDNLMGANFNFIEDNENTDYQTFELKYEHRFKKIIMVLKNSSRNYDSGWINDFAQHLDLYYPKDNYLLNLTLSHYNDGEYVFKLGFEFSDIFSGKNFSLSNLNLWFNTEKTSNLDFRIYIK